MSLSIDITSSLRLPPGFSSDGIQDISFHPKHSSLALASTRDVYEYDIGSRGIISHFPSDGPITHLRHCNDFLIAALHSGAFCTWNLKTGTTQAIVQPVRSSERRPVRCLAVVADMQARVVYVREGMKEVRAADVLTGTVSRVAAFKKPITALATHSNRGLAVAAAEDGTVKVFSGRTGSTKLAVDAQLGKGRQVTWLGFITPPPALSGKGGNIPWVVLGADDGTVKLYGYGSGSSGGSRGSTSRRVKSARLSLSGNSNNNASSDIRGHQLLATYTPYTPQPVVAVLPYPLGPSSLPCMLVLNSSGSLTPVDMSPLLQSSDTQHTHPLLPATMISPFQLPLRNAFQHQSAHHARFAPNLGVFAFVAPLAHPHLPLFSVTDNVDASSFLPPAMRLPPLRVRPDREENGQEVFNIGPAELIYADAFPSPYTGIAVRISSYSLYARQSTLLRTLYPSSSSLSSASASSSSLSSSSPSPSSTNSSWINSFRLIRSIISPRRNFALLFFEHQQPRRDNPQFQWVCTSVRKDSNNASQSVLSDVLQHGRDGAFLPLPAPSFPSTPHPPQEEKDNQTNDEASWYAVVHEDGAHISIYSLSAPSSPADNPAEDSNDDPGNNSIQGESNDRGSSAPAPRHVLRLPFPVNRIFAAPITANSTLPSNPSDTDVPYHRLLVVSTHTTPSLAMIRPHPKQPCYETIPASSSSASQNQHQKIHLRREEIVLDATWRYTPTDVPGDDAFVAVLTSQRILVLDARTFGIQATAAAPAPHREPWAHSLVWAGPTVLYNTPTTVCALPMYGGDGDVQEICTLDDRNAVLCGVLHDRIVFLRHNETGIPEAAVRYVNLLETLLIGLVRLGNATHTDVRPDLRRVLRRFDVRIGVPTLEAVARYGYGQLALQIADAADITLPTYTHYRLATAAGNLSLALDVLRREQFGLATVPQAPRIPQSSPCYPYVVELGRMAAAAGQYSIATECFDMTDQLWELLQIYMAGRDTAGLTRLAERCADGGLGRGEEDGDSISIYLACMRILEQHPGEEYGRTSSSSFADDDNDGGRGEKEKEKEKEKEEEWMVGGVLGPMEAVDNAGKKTAVRSILLNTLGAWMGTEGSSASPDHPSNMSSPGAQQQQHPSHASSLSPPSQPDFGGEFRRSPTPGSSSLSVDDESHTETDTYTQSEMVDEEGFKVNPDQDSMRREYMDTMNTGDGDGDGEEDDPEEAQRRSKLRNIQVNMNRTFSEDPDSLKNIGSFDLGGIGEGTPRKSKSKSKSKRRRRNKQGTADDNSSDGGRQETKKHSDPSRRSKGSAKTISGSTGQRLALDMKRVHEFGDKSDEGEDGSGSDASSSAALSARSSSDTMTSNSSLSVSSPAHHRSSQGHRSQQHRSRSGLGPEQRRGSNVSVSSLDNGLSTPRSTSVNPSDAMKKAMGQLNKGQFPGALKNINKALSVLVKDTSQVAKKKNILICVRYKLLLTLLQHHRDMEKQKDADPQHNALLLVMLAGIPVKSAHRAICYKMAIKANMQCGNNATAARLIRDLLPITPSQYQAEMETKLRQCEEQGMTDTEGFPASAAEQDPAFCWKTFRLLHADDTRAVCNYCRGEYSTAALTGTKEEEEGKEERRDDAGPCPYCTYGRVRLPTPHS